MYMLHMYYTNIYHECIPHLSGRAAGPPRKGFVGLCVWLLAGWCSQEREGGRILAEGWRRIRGKSWEGRILDFLCVSVIYYCLFEQ